MFISLIIPVFNVEKYIERCLLSCINQNISCDDYEIIVVNDGTPDRSMDIVNEYHKNYPHLIKTFSQENKGLSAARNAGLKLAKGDYIWFIDSDDWITTDCLSSIYLKIQKETPDILALCAANIINEKAIRRNKYLDETPKTGKDAFNKMISPCAPFSIYKRDFLIKNNLFFYEGIYHEDSEFMPRAYYNASKVSFHNDIVYNVYPNPQSITRTVNPKKAFDIITVCNSLSDFAKNISKECIKHLSFLIYLMSETDIKKLNEIIYNNRKILVYLKESDISKYKLEYYLFILFPRKYVKIYKILQLFNLKK